MQADKFAINHNRAHSLLKYTPGIISCAGFLLLAAGFLHPFASENSHAVSSDITVSYIDSVISAPTSTAANAGGINFDFTPSVDGTNVAAKDTVTGGSTNVPDYQIYVSVNTADGRMPATSGDAYINATSGAVTDATSSSSIASASTLGSNSWGFALSSFNTSINYNDLVSSSSSSSWSSSKWSKLPYITTANTSNESTVEANATKIYDSNTSSGSSVDVYYAVNADGTLASGDYGTTVTYTLIGNIPTQSVTYMQDMTPSSCATLSIYDPSNSEATTYSVYDKRDGQKYKIRRLYMNTKSASSTACWMVQDLRLTYDSLTDPGSTGATLTSANSNVSSSFTMEAQANPSSSSTQEGIDSKRHKKYNNFYGTYYNWYTATAGTGTYNIATDGANVSASICPGKGANTTTWHLPSGKETTSEFYYLLNAYKDDYGWTDINGSGNTTTNDQSTTIGPNFIYTGLYSDSLSSKGSKGGFWTRTAIDNNKAYNMYLYGDGRVRAGTDDTNKGIGFPIRCILPSS